MTGWTRRALLGLAVLLLAAGAAAAGLSVARTGSARGYPVSQLREGMSAATLQIAHMSQLSKIIVKIERLPSVLEAFRQTAR